ncbi:MAG: hypothetical protein DMG49_01810 [Acidobacteria bacterium]|nr:MAG: hypothetical protein DMG49_01810 [Acidobacteriota bacterium]
MRLDKITRRSWLSWTCVTILVILCTVLALLQYRWIGEIADAEHGRLREDLQSRLRLLRRNFNDQISTACISFVPSRTQMENSGRDQAYLAQYRHAPESGHQVVRRIALAVPKNGDLILLFPDSDNRQFLPARWPAEWREMKERLAARLKGQPVEAEHPRPASLVEFPRFGIAKGARPRQERAQEQEWLILELNLDYLRSTLLPAMLSRYLGDTGKADYDAEAVDKRNPSISVYRSDDGHPIAGHADASVTLLEVGSMPFRPSPKENAGAEPPPDGGHGAWLLVVNHRAGSLEAIVAQARRRNMALAVGLLLLILAMVGALIHFSSSAQQLAELQMNFVSGVSHELRTPLTVIRTAAFNLRAKFAGQPHQVERYAALIQRESEKLGALVEQILRYGSARAGRVIGKREPIAINNLIEDSLESSRMALSGAGFVVERHLQPDLPLVLADQEAMKHVFRNLIDNALTHGTKANSWIGVFAASASNGSGSAVEIRVVDRGPGIPREECDLIFDSFFRGRRAVEQQVHGTGLGLSLAKKIIEAHGGSIRVKSDPREGTEFIVTIPAAPPELQNELAHSPS